MICPNKNSQAWKDLVAKVGEAQALLIFNATNPTGAATPNTKFFDSIIDKVEANPDYYKNKYKDFLDRTLGDTSRTPFKMAWAFAVRAEVEADGELFPKTATDYLGAKSYPSELETALETLSTKFKFPYRVINDPKVKWKGKYLYDGENRVVVVNAAYADATTPFHEYYHPAVRILQLRNPKLFDSIAAEAVSEGVKGTDLEEKVVEYLAIKAKEKGFNFYVAAFLQFIRRILGLGKTLDTATRLSEVLAILNQGVDVSQETTLTEAYRKLDEIVNGIAGSITDRPPSTRGDYLKILRDEFKNVTTSDASNFYQDETGKDIALRLSAFIGDVELGEFSVKYKNKKYTNSEWAARVAFEKAGFSVKDRPASQITETLFVDGHNISFEDTVKYFETIYAKQRIYGKMVHSYIQYLIEQEPAAKAQAKAQAEDYAKQYGTPFVTIDGHENLKPIKENFNLITEAAGILIPNERTIGLPKEKYDRVAAETVFSSSLITDSEGKPIGTTADGLIQHENGDFSLIDWKTGNIVKDKDSPYLLQYGEELGLSDSKLTRAYLELAFRALILKEKFPDATFRNIQLVKLDSKGNAKPMKLDLQPYLWVISNYYKKNSPKTYEALNARGLFDVANYQGTSSAIVKVFDQIKNLHYEDQLAYLRTKLATLHHDKTKEEIASNPQLKQLSIEYTEAILELEKVNGTDLGAKTPDLPYLVKGFKNFSDIANPKVQTLHKVIMQGKNKTTEALKEYNDKLDTLYTDLAQEQLGKKKWLDYSAGVALTYSLITLNPLWLVGTVLSHRLISKLAFPSTKSHFGFMWKKSDNKARPGYFLNQEDYWVDDKGNRFALTPAQKAFRSFIVSTMRKEYEETMSEIVDYEYDNPTRPIPKWKAMGLPQTLPDDFLPRVPKPIEEIREEEGLLAGGIGIKTRLGHRAKVFFTSFIEDKFEDKSTPIPLKYFLHDNSSIIEDSAHSFNVEAAFRMFMGNLLYKKNMDSVYDIAIGTKNALEEETDETGKKRYPHLTEWLDDSIFPVILGTSKDSQLMTRKWTWKVGTVMNKVTGIAKGTPLIISQERVLRMMKSSVTFMTMAFKVWGPVRNALMLSLATVTKTVNFGTFISKIAGVPPDAVDELSIKGASTVFKDFVAKKMQNKEEESKLWALAKKFNWLPDNYPYQVNNDSLLSKSIQMSLTSHAYMFYQMGENFGALWHLAAMMQAVKVKTIDGKLISMWDAYNDKGEWTAGARGIVQLGNGVTKELKELDELEIKTLKRGFEQLQGSYRQDEKTALEATVIGDFIFQFKKYFYQYMKVLFASQYKDQTIGKYVLTGNRPDGMPVYQWHSEVMEGQLTVLAGSVLALLDKSRSVKQYLNESPLYDSSTLKGHRKRALASLANTGIWFALLLGVFSMFFDDDDDKKSFLAREFERTIYDNTRGVAPKDLFETIKKPVVASERIANIGTATWSFLTEGIFGETTQDGWLKGSKTILRAAPGIGGAMQLRDLFKDVDPSQTEDLFDIIPVR